MRYLIANWKSNKSAKVIAQWFDELEPLPNHASNLTVVVCPAFPFLEQVSNEIKQRKLDFKVGAQDISPFPKGSYTGAVAADMIEQYAEFVIVGHSERRRYFKETSQEVANKIDMTQKANMTPILCLDQSYAKEQLNALSGETSKEALILVHEPISSISTNTGSKPDNPEHANSIARELKTMYNTAAPVLYGGSMDETNAGDYIIQSHIDGGLVGNASLDAKKWSKMIKKLSTAD